MTICCCSGVWLEAGRLKLMGRPLWILCTAIPSHDINICQHGHSLKKRGKSRKKFFFSQKCFSQVMESRWSHVKFHSGHLLCTSMNQLFCEYIVLSGDDDDEDGGLALLWRRYCFRRPPNVLSQCFYSALLQFLQKNHSLGILESKSNPKPNTN